MDPLKRSKVITGVCGGLTVCLLATTVIAFAKTPFSKDNDSSGVNIELDPRVYNGVMGFFDYYAKGGGGNVQYAAASQTDSPFITKDGKIYVVIDGHAYPVIETDDGLVVPSSATDPDHLIGTYDLDGHKIIAVTEDGLPIIGYDKDGNPIIGRLEGEKPIEDVLPIDNPRITVDEFGNKWYHIVWGDTLCDISSDIHYSVDELAEYNHIRNVNLIYAESDLRIPEGEWTEPPSDNATAPKNTKLNNEAAVPTSEPVAEPTAEPTVEPTTEPVGQAQEAGTIPAESDTDSDTAETEKTSESAEASDEDDSGGEAAVLDEVLKK